MQTIRIVASFAMLFTAPFLPTAFGQSVSLKETKSSLKESAKELKGEAGDKTSSLVRVSASNADSAEPDIAAAPDGGVYLIWVEHRENKEADVFLQKFDSGKNPVGEKVRVNPRVGEATAWRGDPPTVKVGTDNTVYVGWTARVPVAEGSANDLFLSVSRDGGKTFGAPVKVNDDKIPAPHGMHSMTIGKNNRVYFSWLDERYLQHEEHQQAKTERKAENKPDGAQKKHEHMEANREVYFAVSKDGGKSFGKNKKLAADACPCCKTSILDAPDGRIYVSWRQVLPEDFRHIAVASSDDGGKSFAPAAIVSDDKWQIGGCPVSGASLAVGDDNVLRTVWFTAGDAGKPGLYTAQSTDGGKTFSPRALLYEGRVAGTPLLFRDKTNNLKIVWQSDGKILQLTFQTTPGNIDKVKEIAVGKFPSATIAGEKLFVAFIQTETDKRGIWLY